MGLSAYVLKGCLFPSIATDKGLSLSHFKDESAIYCVYCFFIGSIQILHLPFCVFCGDLVLLDRELLPGNGT